MNLLILTARFLDNRYHGLLTKKGPPEWPPSPYRLFQALVSGVARRGELVEGEDVLNNKNLTPIGRALDWLQKHTSIHPPVIIAPRSKAYQKGDGVICFVPNNDNETHFHPELHRVAKPTIPTHMLLEPDEKPEVHYVWDISSQPDTPVDRIRDAARSLTTLGWGIDMAFADARLAIEDDIEKLKGIRWYPKKNAGSFHDTLRTPTYNNETKECTLCDLRHCHETAMNRIEHGKPLHTVDKPKVFDSVLYASIEPPIGRPFVVFALRTDTDDSYRYPHAKLIHIAGMVRHLAIERMKTDPPLALIKDEQPADWVNHVVRGKRDESTGDQHKQFSYVPLPSIGHAHADAMIRNVMIVAPLGMDRELEYLAERLNGEPLTAEGDAGACETNSAPNISKRIELQRFNPPPNKFIAQSYLGMARAWHSVTPVILPGYDDHKPAKTIKLIQSALQQSGIETPCKFTWQAIPFLKNCLSAHKYDRNGRHTGYHRPTHLKDLTAVHVQLTFEHPIPGPITIGAGRHCGLGTFAAVKEGKS